MRAQNHDKGQAAIEFISTYGWALLIIAIAIALFAIVISAPANVVPTSCVFTYGTRCSDLIIGTSQGNSRVAILFSNSQDYPILSPSLVMNISGQPSIVGTCSPSFVLPGGAIICNATISQKFSAGSLLTGKLSLTYKLCQTGNATTCSSSPVQTYSGTFNTHTTPLLEQTPLAITLHASNLTAPADGALNILIAHLTLLGYPLSGATINFTSSASFAVVSPHLSNTGDNGTAYSYVSSISTTGSTRINATFANVTASVILDFVPVVGVTFQTSTMMPNTGETVSVDGTSYNYIQLPKTALFGISTTHSYSFNSLVYGSSTTRYSFGGTSGCGLASAQSGSITASENCTMEGLYTTQYLVSTSASPSYAGSTSPNTWFNTGSSTTISETPSSGYFFTGWSGTGTGSYTGGASSNSIIVGGPITEIANYIVALSVTASANPTSIDLGQSTTLSASPSGGSGSNTYSWTVASGTSCPGFTSSTSSSFTYVPSGTSSDCEFVVTATDSDGEMASGTTQQITIYPTLASGSPSGTASPSSPVTIDVGQTEAVSASASGGSGSYSYSWAVTGGTSCPGFGSSTSSSFIYSPSSTSSDCKFTQTVTDTVTGATATATTAQITVDSAVVAGSPSGTASPSSTVTIDVGESQPISTAASGGTGSYSYSWAVTGGTSCPGFSSSTSNSFSYTPSSTSSNCKFTATVTDANTGATATATTSQITVDSASAGTAYPSSPVTIDVNQGQTVSVTGSGGSGSYSYSWAVTGGTSCPGFSSTTSNSFTYVPSSTSSGCKFTATVTDSNGGTAMATTAQITVDSALVAGSPSGTASPSSAVTMDVGQTHSVSVSASGGSGSYSYSWTVTGGTSCPGFTSSTSSSFTYSPSSTTSGCKFTATVTDANTGATATATTAQITVDSSPSTTVLPSSSLTMDQGQSTTISASPSGGSGSYSYSWAVTGGTSCPGFTSSTSSSFTYSPSSTTSDCKFTATVTDSNGGTTMATTAQITVDSAVVAGSPSGTASPSSAVTMDVGQTQPVSVSASGGTGSYSYSWAVTGGTSCPGFSSTVSSSFTYSPSSASSNCKFTATVTDTNTGATATATTAQITVDSSVVAGSPSGTASPSSAVTMDVGQTQAVSVSASGGTGSYSYSWAVTGGTSCPGFTSSTSSSFTYSPSSTTSDCGFTVTVTDSNGGTAMATTAQITVDSALVAGSPSGTASPSSPATIYVDQTQPVSVSASGGTGSYMYSWAVTGGTSCPGFTSSTSSSFTYSPSSTTSDCKFTATVTDATTGATATATTAQITVNPVTTTTTTSTSTSSTTSTSVSTTTTTTIIPYFYAVGTDTGIYSGYTSSYYASATGGVGTWIQTTNYPSASPPYACAVSSSLYIYCVDSGSSYYASVSGGSIGSWSATTAYPSGHYINDGAGTGDDADNCFINSNYIYCVDGYSDTNTYYAPISSSGIGSWTQTTSAPSGVENGLCFASSNYIYCTGSSTYYAQLSSSGIGSWTSTASPPSNANGYLACTASSGYVYCMAPAESTSSLSVTEYAPLSSSGIGSWSSTTGVWYYEDAGYASEFSPGGPGSPPPYSGIAAYASPVACASTSGYLYCGGVQSFYVYADNAGDGICGYGYANGVQYDGVDSVYYASTSGSGLSSWTVTNSNDIFEGETQTANPICFASSSCNYGDGWTMEPVCNNEYGAYGAWTATPPS